MTRAIVLLPLLALLASCGGFNTKQSPLDQALYEYVSVIRWSDFDRALGFIDPLSLEVDPLDSIELERLKQYQVTGYDVRTSNWPSEVEYQQDVEIRVVNKHTQSERTIIDRQRWRWDDQADRWWLVSGLPDVNPDD